MEAQGEVSKAFLSSSPVPHTLTFRVRVPDKPAPGSQAELTQHRRAPGSSGSSTAYTNSSSKALMIRSTTDPLRNSDVGTGRQIPWVSLT